MEIFIGIVAFVLVFGIFGKLVEMVFTIFFKLIPYAFMGLILMFLLKMCGG